MEHRGRRLMILQKINLNIMKKISETNNVFLKKIFGFFVRIRKEQNYLKQIQSIIIFDFALIEIIEYYKELGDNEQCLFELARLVEVILMMENKRTAKSYSF